MMPCACPKQVLQLELHAFRDLQVEGVQFRLTAVAMTMCKKGGDPHEDWLT